MISSLPPCRILVECLQGSNQRSLPGMLPMVPHRVQHHHLLIELLSEGEFEPPQELCLFGDLFSVDSLSDLNKGWWQTNHHRCWVSFHLELLVLHRLIMRIEMKVSFCLTSSARVSVSASTCTCTRAGVNGISEGRLASEVNGKLLLTMCLHVQVANAIPFLFLRLLFLTMIHLGWSLLMPTGVSTHQWTVPISCPSSTL